MRFLYFLWSGYILYLIYQVYAYIKGKHLVSNMEIYNTFFLKKIVLAVLILVISYVLSHFGKITLAKWVAGVPALISGIILLLGVLAWSFTWFVMWLGKQP